MSLLHEGESEASKHLRMQVEAFGSNPLAEFMLKYGKDYATGPQTYEGERGERGQCYANATHLALDDRSLTYIEGKVSVYGVPINHAWCVNADGIVIDPTLAPSEHDGLDRIRGYFGIPFQTDYVLKAVLRNKVYGLLDGYYARKTLPKLIELGLEGGQRWLIGKRRTAKEAA